MRRIDDFAAGVVVGIIVALAVVFLVLVLRAPAHARPLVMQHSAWSPPGCTAAALGRHAVQWTCSIEEASR